MIEEKITNLKEDNDDDYYYEYEIEELIKTKVTLLQQIGEEEKALKEKCYGIIVNFADQLLELYYNQKEIEKYKSLLNDVLFKYSRGSYKYYKKLKELYSKEEWKKERDSIIQEFEKDGRGYHTDDLRKIYIEEQYFDKLYKSVMEIPLYEIIINYEKYLKKDYEKEILQEYERIIDEKAQYTLKKNYQEIRDILEHIKTLKNGKELVKNKIEEYKAKYANRPSMLKELNGIKI